MAKKRERFHTAWWEIRDAEDDDKPRPYWYGYCEGDKDGDRLGYGEPLIMDPSHFPIGTRIDVEEPEDPGFYEQLYAQRGQPDALANPAAAACTPTMLEVLLEVQRCFREQNEAGVLDLERWGGLWAAVGEAIKGATDGEA